MSRRQGVMLCYPWEAKRLAKWPKPWIIQPKYKGIRCKTYIMNEGSVVMVSSEGNIINSVPTIKKAIEIARLAPGTILDGELYLHDVHQGEVNSIVLRKDIHPDHLSINYEVFDTPYMGGYPLHERLTMVNTIVNTIDSRLIKKVPSLYIEKADEITTILFDLKEQHYEGIVAKNHESLYEEKRSTNWMKWKPGEIDSYPIVGFKEEVSIQGEPKDSLGSLVCQTDLGETFSVGTGLTHDQRKLFWRHRDLLVGMRVTVGYAELTARGVPEHPVVISID